MAILASNNNKDETATTPQGSPFLPTTSMPSNQTQSYTAPKKPQQGSGRFTNIQSYLSAANPEKTGQQSGGQQIQSGIQNQQNKNAESIREGIAKSQEQFGNAYNPENTRLHNAQPFVQNTLQSAQTAPSTLTEDQINQFRGLATGAGDYKNINGLTGTPDTSQLQSAAQMAGTEPGRFELLRSTFNRPSYNAGQQKLDQLLLQNQGGGNLQRNLSELATNVGGERTAAIDQAKNQADALKTLAGNISTQATKGVGDAETGLEKSVNDRATELGGQYKNLSGYLKGALGGNGVASPDDALKLAQNAGLDLNMDVTGLKQSGLDPTSFINNMDFNANTVASPEERARAAMLSKLAGGEQTFLAGNPTDKADIHNILNTSEIQRANQSADAAYKAQLDPFQQTVNKYSTVQDVAKDMWSGQDNYDKQINDLKEQSKYLAPQDYGRRSQIDKQVNDLMSQKDQMYEDVVNKYGQQLDPGILDDLRHSKEILGGPNDKTDPYMSIYHPIEQNLANSQNNDYQGLGEKITRYLDALKQSQGQLNNLTSQHQTLSLGDLLKRGAASPLQTNTPNASKDRKVGVS